MKSTQNQMNSTMRDWNVDHVDPCSNHLLSVSKYPSRNQQLNTRSQQFDSYQSTGDLTSLDGHWTGGCQYQESLVLPQKKLTQRLQCGAPKIAKLVNITPISLWFIIFITIVNGVYKPTYNWGGPHCGKALKKPHNQPRSTQALQWREQLLRRKNVSLLSLSLTLVHCGLTPQMDLGNGLTKSHGCLKWGGKRSKNSWMIPDSGDFWCWKLSWKPVSSYFCWVDDLWSPKSGHPLVNP